MGGSPHDWSSKKSRARRQVPLTECSLGWDKYIELYRTTPSDTEIYQFTQNVYETDQRTPNEPYVKRKRMGAPMVGFRRRWCPWPGAPNCAPPCVKPDLEL